MAEPFLAELRLMSFNFAPKGWAQCNGQLLPINQNQPLFALLGTTYGGNGQTNFALPNLIGRVPVHRGGNAGSEGHSVGEQAHTLTQSEMPAHTHFAIVHDTPPAQVEGNVPGPAKRLSHSDPLDLWGPAAALQPMNAGMINNAGGSQAHENMMPYTAIGFCIALQGIFPST